MKIEKKPLIFIIAGALILILIFILARQTATPDVKKDELGRFITREVISEIYQVPEKDTPNLPPNIARPKIVAPASADPSKVESVRIFDIAIENDKFSPDTIIINDWDNVVLYVKAVDKDYDFIQPNLSLSHQIPKGETVIVRSGFGGTGGVKLFFYCASCGGPTEGPLGQILTVPRERPE